MTRAALVVGIDCGIPVSMESPLLLEIAARLRTQDNRITENPMFCVQQKRRVTGLDPRWTDNTIWYHNGEKVDEECEGAIRVGILDYWETVMVAFTEGGCQEYLRQNAHNLREPRIYVESFNRCPEMIAIREWLLAKNITTPAPNLDRHEIMTGTNPLLEPDHKAMLARLRKIAAIATLHEQVTIDEADLRQLLAFADRTVFAEIHRCASAQPSRWSTLR